MGSSFVQTSFLGGEWGPLAQGRMTDPAYKTACSVMFNAIPLEVGSWVRRSGARFLAHTRGGAPARLRAFDFNVNNPFQMEFTNGFVRFFEGLSLLTTLHVDGVVLVAKFLSTNPAAVQLGSPVPAGWANGDTVIFRLPTVPVTCTAVLGRQFVIANLDTAAQTFTLVDPITGDAVDGTNFVYVVQPDGSLPDTAEKVLEIVTPYTGTTWEDVQLIQNDQTALLVHPDFQPRVLTMASARPVSIDAQDFTDGPYLDINPGNTHFSLSGLTGSVTVTAGGTSNVNHGLGFLSTDVGRLIRFQGGPASWDSGTTYSKNATVLGSDENIYLSLVGANIGHDPTLDDGSNWQLSATVVTWSWLKITAFTDNLHVTATIMGPDLPQAASTTQWQMGLYSDSTGWPSTGTYHEGRLWLAGQGVDFVNRIDGSVSNDFFNFAPTASDGTVADDNGVSATFNANDLNNIFWMLSTEDGLILGAQSGEWRVKASALDDPISPTSIQVRRVSTYGSADILPVQPGGQTVFVQRQQRRLLAHEQITAGSYGASNLAQNAAHLTEGGIAEIVYQQEPLLTIWARRTDGTLIGCTFQKIQYSGYALEKAPFNGWHEHDICNGRLVQSIQGGPAFDGLADAVYMVTNRFQQGGAPDNFVHWVQVLDPVFEAATEDWEVFYVDGGGTPPYAQLFQTSNGDPFDGVRIFSLWPLNGQTVAPVLGGLDLGDRLVADGQTDVPFSSDPEAAFTLAFFQALSNGTDYGVFDVAAGSVVDGAVVTPSIANNNLLGLVGNDATVVGTGSVLSDEFMHVDSVHNRCIQMAYGSTPGMRAFDGSSGIELAQTARTMYGTPSYLHDNGNIYQSVGGTNTAPIAEISTGLSTFGAETTSGSSGSSTTGSGAGHFQWIFNTITGITVPDEDSVDHAFIIFVGLRGGQQLNEVTLASVGSGVTWIYSDQLNATTTDTTVSVCRGPVQVGLGSWFASEKPFSTWPGDNSPQVALYKYFYTGGVVRVPIVQLTPSMIDASWGSMSAFLGPAYDAADGCIIFFAQTTDVVTNQNYIVKLDPNTAEILWVTPLPNTIVAFTEAQVLAEAKINGKMVFLNAGGSNHNAYVVDTLTGALTIIGINTGFTGFDHQMYDYLTGAVTIYGDYAPPGTGPTMTFLGAYLPAHGDTLSSQWGRFFTGQTYVSDDTVTTYNVPFSVGLSYTSQGQLLRPDSGPDAGARNGPAFGKKRRLHWYAGAFFRTRLVKMGTDFSATLRPVPMLTPGGKTIAAPTLFTDTVSTTIDNDYSFDAQIAWQITRPYPCNVTAIGAYLETQDK